MSEASKHRGTGAPNDLDRREAIASMGVGIMGAYGVGSPSWEKFKNLQQQAPTFFNAAETALLSALVNIIIPRDAKSGSATDAGAIPYMDFVVGDGSERSKTAWRDGLRWYDEESGRRFNKTFVAASEAERIQVVDLVAWPARAAAELRPQVDFFNRVRDLTASAFFSSRMGVEDLGYTGGVVNVNWTGAPPEALRELGVSYAEWDAKYGRAPSVPTGPRTTHDAPRTGRNHE